MRKEPKKNDELQKELNELYKNLNTVSKLLSDNKLTSLILNEISNSRSGLKI